MKARDRIHEQLRPRMLLLYGGFALFLVSIVLARKSKFAIVPGLVGFGTAFISMLAIQFGVRCPFCRTKLGQMIMASGRVWTLGPEFNFYHRCGTSLDQEIAE